MKMTRQILADRMNGRQYQDELTDDEEELAKAAGLIVIFAYSDDCIELRGVVNDEVDGYGGKKFFLTSRGWYEHWDKDGDMKEREEAENYFKMESSPKAEIDATCNNQEHDTNWTITTEVPHSVFMIYEDEEKFCQGIVVSIHDFPSPQVASPLKAMKPNFRRVDPVQKTATKKAAKPSPRTGKPAK